MKKLLFSVAMLAAGSAAFAQISAGTLMLGGTIGFNSESGSVETTGAPVAVPKVELPSTSSFNLGITGGYFLNDNLAIGASIGFGSTSDVTKRSYDKTTGVVSTPPLTGADDVAFDDENKASGFGINLFANMYNDINGKWMWYYGAGLGFGTASGTTTVVEETSPGVWAHKSIDAPSTTTISLGANLGVLHFLSDNWALQAGLNNLLGFDYEMGKAEVKNGAITTTTSTSEMNLTLGTGSFGLGAVNVGIFYFIR
ncbi:MAG: outer membrane beta-barrel protein [Bacteroidota bacterium]|jgi:hypothetical protein